MMGVMLINVQSIDGRLNIVDVQVMNTSLALLMLSLGILMAGVPTI